MHVETEGIVLKETASKGNSRTLSLLTAKLGRINAVARGAKSLRSSLSAPSSQFTYSRFVLFCSGDRTVIDSAEPLELFIELRDDLERLSLAQYFTELTYFCAEENAPAPKHLQLLANSLYMLAKTQRLPLFIKACFELRMMSLCGYMPYLDSCGNCKKEDAADAVFIPDEGTYLCTKCSAYGGLPITSGMLSAMRHITQSDSKQLFSFSLSDDTSKRLSGVTEQFVSCQLDRTFPTLDFYKSLNIKK